jgi:quinohemoprotein ethanol dehydrogenase
VAGDVVVIGNAGADYDTRGYVSAFDLETWEAPVALLGRSRATPDLGRRIIPISSAPSRRGTRTAAGTLAEGGAPWDAINYDAETGLVLVGTGNGGPYHTGQALTERRRSALPGEHRCAGCEYRPP